MLKKFKERLANFEINPAKFYNIGVWAFGIIAIFNTFSYIQGIMVADSISELNFLLVISGGASLVFNYALWGFFHYLKGTIPPENLEKGTLADMEKIMYDNEKEVKKYGKGV